MLFPYWQVDDDGQAHVLPLVPLTVHGPDRSLEGLQALVDSGAEHNVFGMTLARRLGISVEHGTFVEIAGFADAQAPGRLVTVDLQLGRHRWTAPVVFSEAVDHHLLLGQAGFFAFFNIRFRYAQGCMDIQRTRSRASRAVGR